MSSKKSIDTLVKDIYKLFLQMWSKKNYVLSYFNFFHARNDSAKIRWEFCHTFSYNVTNSKGTGKKLQHIGVKNKCIAEFNTFSKSTIFFFQINPKEFPFSTQKRIVNRHIICHAVRDFEHNPTNLV